MVLVLLNAPLAHATFHEMSIREIYPGSSAEPEAEYVELQMWNGGQNLVGGHVLRTYDAAGGLIGANAFPANVPAGANQSTILMATAQAETRFALNADGPISPSGQLDPAGGAVCWENLDCASWGSFGGFDGTAPSPTGTPAAAIPDGMALRRTIAPGCATLLEPTDDQDNSAADFSAVFPSPRPNSTAPSERPCGRAGGGQTTEGGSGASGQHGAPQTTLRRKPAKKSHDRTPTFRFGFSEPGSSFQCKLDSGPYKACSSPFTTKRLSLGHHTFKVRARDDSGKLDPSPAVYGFKVVAKR
jgi:hypothetical protein